MSYLDFSIYFLTETGPIFKDNQVCHKNEKQ